MYSVDFIFEPGDYDERFRELNAIIDAAFAGVNSGLADQLYQAAKLIAARNSLGVARQGFFTSMAGTTRTTSSAATRRTGSTSWHLRWRPSSGRSTGWASPTR